MIAAGDPRPPELRRQSQRFRAQRQPPSPVLREASCGFARASRVSLSPREHQKPLGPAQPRERQSRAAEQSCGRVPTAGPCAVTTGWARALGAALALQPRGLPLQTAPEAETSGAGGSGPASCAPSARASRTACDRSGAGRRGRARTLWTRRRAGCGARWARAPAEQPPSPGPRRGRRVPAPAREDSLQTP